MTNLWDAWQQASHVDGVPDGRVRYHKSTDSYLKVGHFNEIQPAYLYLTSADAKTRASGKGAVFASPDGLACNGLECIMSTPNAGDVVPHPTPQQTVAMAEALLAAHECQLAHNDATTPNGFKADNFVFDRLSGRALLLDALPYGDYPNPASKQELLNVVAIMGMTPGGELARARAEAVIGKNEEDERKRKEEEGDDRSPSPPPMRRKGSPPRMQRGRLPAYSSDDEPESPPSSDGYDTPPTRGRLGFGGARASLWEPSRDAPQGSRMLTIALAAAATLLTSLIPR